MKKIIYGNSNCCRLYLENYGYSDEQVKELKGLKSPSSLVNRFFKIVKDDKIYLLIDEYDQFANAILAYSMKDFLDIVGKGGFVRSFYEELFNLLNQSFKENDFITLIYSMGFITIQNEDFGEVLEFCIPNYVIKMLYFNYFAVELQHRNNLTISLIVDDHLLTWHEET